MVKAVASKNSDNKIFNTLVLDELFDLSLYQAVSKTAKGDLKLLLDELIAIETKHLAFWQDLFNKKQVRLDFRHKIKLYLILFIIRVGGEKMARLILEAIEIYGIRKYLELSRVYQGTELSAAVRGILKDELSHEEKIVSGFSERNINPEKIRNIFLGFNDGLVEILGAVSGFFAAFGEISSVLIAGFTTAVAGSLSMAAGIYVAANSESEIRELERQKEIYLKKKGISGPEDKRPLLSSLIVGISYLFGAIVPIIPILLGARSLFYSIIFAGSMIIAVSIVLSFLSGMEVKKRILINFVIITSATAITYAIGIAAKRIIS